MKHSVRDRKPVARYHRLENRQLLAGDVQVFDDVNLYIRGDQHDNQLEIVVTDDQLEVKGLNGTTINGQPSYVVGGSTMTESGVTYEGGLRVHLGPGNDDFTLTDTQFEALSVVFGGSGDDQIKVNTSRFLDRTTIQTYDGNDVVSTSGSQFDGDFYMFTLDGQDSVSALDTEFNGDSILVSGEHSDWVHLEGNHYTGETNLVLSGDGVDVATLNNPIVGQTELGIYMGNDDDTINVDLSNSTVEGSITISGQLGTDELPVMSMNDDVAETTTMLGIENVGETVNGEVAFDGTGKFDVAAGGTKYGDSGLSYLTADYFQMEETTEVSSIEWRGLYSTYLASEIPEIDNFTIEIYEDGIVDVHGIEIVAPVGDPIATFEVSDSVERALTGDVFTEEHSPGLPIDIYRFSADVDFVAEGGKKYWVSIFTTVDYDESSGDYDYDFRWGGEITGNWNPERVDSSAVFFENTWYVSKYSKTRMDFLFRS